ncbi:DUF5819 family protein [Streptomyces sp. NPDC021608]|uniref:DUF5819 family protein n=1 Tax=Streptomyces sp. NPDC021608 TaxID=3154903 RepID=UPI0033E7F3EE
MDAYDGGSGAPQGRGRAEETRPPGAEGALSDRALPDSAPPEGVALPGPRSELPGSEDGPRAESGHAAGGGSDADAPEADGPGAGTSEAGGPGAGTSEAGRPEAGVSEAGDFEAGGPQAPAPTPARAARGGVAALSPRYQVCAALALAVVAVAVCLHVGMVFLHVAPSNTVTKTHGKAIDDWIYPEFEQNWKLFAPNPLQQNISVQVRAQVRTADGGSRTTGWYDLSAQDGRAIDGNLVPSHTQQNELRRAWDFFTATHDNDNRSVGVRGALAETYLRRIVVLRLERGGLTAGGGVVERVQVRSRTTNVTPPKWSTEKVSTSPVYRELSWWSVPDGATEGGTR